MLQLEERTVICQFNYVPDVRAIKDFEQMKLLLMDFQSFIVFPENMFL